MSGHARRQRNQRAVTDFRPAALLAIAVLALPLPGHAQGLDECAETGLTVESQVKGDIPLGGPIALGSWREVQRDVVMEEDIAAQLAPLGYVIDDNAFWQLVYETDSQHPTPRRPITLDSQVQGGKQPEAVGRYSFERDDRECPPLSTYTMTFEILDTGSRVVWRGHATNLSNSDSPVADKERMVERLINALRSDLRDVHNMPGDR